MPGVISRCLNSPNRFAAVLGGQWGDEGKGKLVDWLSNKYDIIARFNGGDNSGHIICKGDKKFALNALPCGIINQSTINLIGNGCVVNLKSLFNQLQTLQNDGISYKDRIFVSSRAHLVFQHYRNHDLMIEKRQGIGITGRGIGPAYAAKAHRYGLRVGDLKNWNIFQEKYLKMMSFYPQKINYAELQDFKKFREKLYSENIVVDGTQWINKQYNSGKKILAEGSNGSLLDTDLGTYPYVAANPTNIGSIGTGLGISPRKIDTVIGVVKAYTTRVEQGPFASELVDSTGFAIREAGEQYGIVTGRQRRCGWLDLSLVKYAVTLNGFDAINITKLDVLDQLQEIKVAVEHTLNGKQIALPPQTIFEFGRVKTVYETFKGWKTSLNGIRKKEDLPQEAKDYLKFIQNYLETPIQWVGVGRQNDAFISML